MATMKDLMEYEGTETDPFIVEKPFDPDDLENMTPFGTRWGGDVITLTLEQHEALKNGKYIAIDVEREYVAFLKLDNSEPHPHLNPKNMEEALKKADISPKSSFNQYAIDAIAKTTPCLKNWRAEDKADNQDTSSGASSIDSETLNGMIRQSADEILISWDAVALSLAFDVLVDEFIVVHREVIRLRKFNQYQLEKSQIWEERARALYRELYGKDAPPQG